MAYVQGVDISVIQGKVDFPALVANGVQFVVIRCGVGNGGIDSLYAQNVTAAKAAGLQVAAYHFIYPLPPETSQPLRDPVAQAQYHFNAAQGQLACIDCEWPAPQDFGKWGCSSAQLNQWMLAYLTEYERLDGRKPIIYTYPYWAANVGFQQTFSQYPLWIASYEAQPAIPLPWNDWVLWQTTGGGGHLPTSGVPVDTDASKDLSLWSVAVITPVVVVPPPAPMPPPPVVAPVEIPTVAPTPAPAVVAPSTTLPTVQELGNIISVLLSWLAKFIGSFKE